MALKYLVFWTVWIVFFFAVGLGLIFVSSVVDCYTAKMILMERKEIPWLKMSEWETIKEGHGMSMQTKKRTGILKRKPSFRIIDQTFVLSKASDRVEVDRDWTLLLTEKTSSGHASRARSFSNTHRQSAAAPSPFQPQSSSSSLGGSGPAVPQKPAHLRSQKSEIGSGSRIGQAESPSAVRAVPAPPATKVEVEKLTLDDVLSPTNSSDKFVDQKFIGEGAAAAIYLARNREDNRWVAIKKISRKSGKLVNSVKWLVGEIHVLRQLYHHPNIVNFYDAFASGDEVWVVMEYMDWGCMTELLDKYAMIQMRESHIAFVCFQLLRALTFIHDNGYIHRDIKSDNVLLGRGGRVKLADFGFSAQLNSKNDKRSTLVGTPYWMPPELIRGQPYDQKADVWSLGILVMEMAEGQPPYIEYESMRALHIISTRGAPPLKEQNRWSYDLKKFLEACLEMDPVTRARAHTLLQHSFLINACSAGEFDNFVLEANKLCPPPE